MNQLKPTDRPGAWSFETDAMKGELSADAETHLHGITSLTQKSTGRQVVRERLFCLHLYRVLARNQWFSQCRDVPHTAKLEGDELVVQWPLTKPEVPGFGPGLEAEARYRVAAVNAVDLTVTIKNTTRWHRDLELFTSNYFDAAMNPCFYTVTPYRGPVGPKNAAVLTQPLDNPCSRFCYNGWPRDIFAAQKFFDGRWEYGTHSPVAWAIGRWFAYPFGFYATGDRKTIAVVMARPDDCFGMCSSYHSDDPKDGVAHHNSLYHNLLGRDVGPASQHTLRQRLVLTDWVDDDAPLKAYQEFVAAMQPKPAGNV